jgi:hypothetical protein
LPNLEFSLHKLWLSSVCILNKYLLFGYNLFSFCNSSSESNVNKFTLFSFAYKISEGILYGFANIIFELKSDLFELNSDKSKLRFFINSISFCDAQSNPKSALANVFNTCKLLLHLTA